MRNWFRKLQTSHDKFGAWVWKLWPWKCWPQFPVVDSKSHCWEIATWVKVVSPKIIILWFYETSLYLRRMNVYQLIIAQIVCQILVIKFIASYRQKKRPKQAGKSQISKSNISCYHTYINTNFWPNWSENDSRLIKMQCDTSLMFFHDG